MLTSAEPAPPVERYVYLEVFATAEDIIDLFYCNPFLPYRWTQLNCRTGTFFFDGDTLLKIYIYIYVYPLIRFLENSDYLIILSGSLSLFLLSSFASSFSLFLLFGVSEPTSALLVVRDPSSFVWRAGRPMASSKFDAQRRRTRSSPSIDLLSFLPSPSHPRHTSSSSRVLTTTRTRIIILSRRPRRVLLEFSLWSYGNYIKS